MVALFLTLVRLTRVIRSNWKDPEFRALFMIFVFLLAGGTWFYSVVEGWSVLDALYFSMVTMTTVGYGDFSPKTPSGKLFTIAYLAVGIGVFVSLAGKLAIVASQLPKAELVKHAQEEHSPQPIPPDPSDTQDS